MTGNAFPFHVDTRPTAARVEDAIGAGRFRDEDNDSLWIQHSELGRIGFFRLEDISDGSPLFDLRLSEAYRGRGLGTQILHAAADHVFRSMPAVRRFEGNTRRDNIAMRKTFVRAGWVKEAHYREGWPVEGGAPIDSVAYAILRRDWESGRTTPVVWDDLAEFG